MSVKPISQKLLVKPGMTLAVVDVPAGFAASLVLPEDVTLAEGLTSSADVTVVFVESLGTLQEQLEALEVLERPDAIVWVAYPKGRPKEEINRDSVFEQTRSDGRWNTVSQVAVDETWSALRIKRVA